jgi:hypothetical protein
MSNHFSLDRLNSVSPTNIGQVAMTALDRLQKFPPEEQVAGVAVLLQLITKRYGVHTGNVLTVANNLVDQAVSRCPELRAAVQYVKHEL